MSTRPDTQGAPRGGCSLHPQSLVQENVSSEIQSWYYLGSYTTGEAVNAIQTLLSLTWKSPTAHMDAKIILIMWCGNKHRMCEAFKNDTYLAFH